MSTAAEIAWTPQVAKTELCSVFDNVPFGVAHCARQGNVTALNPALEQMLGGRAGFARPVCFADLVNPDNRAEAERLFGELFERQRDSFQIDSQTTDTNSRLVRWTAWRVPGTNGNPDYALALAEEAPRDREAEQRLRQAERLEAVGRLAGGVAHD